MGSKVAISVDGLTPLHLGISQEQSSGYMPSVTAF